MDDKSKTRGAVCVYEIDADDRIVFCNDVWDIFARENDGRSLIFENIEGKLLWDFVADPSTSDLYKRLVAHVRAGGVVRFSLRCDSPSLFRLLEMKIALTKKKHVRFSTRVKKIEDRCHQSLHFSNLEVSKEPLLVCSWCGRVNIHRRTWQSVDVAVTQLKIFELSKMPPLSHGICPSCLKNISSLLDKGE